MRLQDAAGFFSRDGGGLLPFGRHGKRADVTWSRRGDSGRTALGRGAGGDMALPFSSRLRGVNEVDGCGGPSSNTGHGGGVRGMLLQGG